MTLAQRTKRFDAVSRTALTLLALYGAFIALGGDVGAKEGGLVLACVGLNELRLRTKLERSNARMFLFWILLFGAAPLLYLLLHIDSLQPESGMLEKVLLPPVIVALALPFQVFAAYLPGIPRAQHLVYAFVLVEAVLGIRNGRPHPLWPWLMVLVAGLGICFVLSHASTAGRTARKARRLGGAEPTTPGDLLQSGLARVGIPVMFWVIVLAAMLFMLLPRMDMETLLRDSSKGRPDDPSAEMPGEGPSRLPPRGEPFNPFGPDPGPRTGPRTPNEAPRGVSGLSNAVKLGEFGAFLRDPTLVGRVRVTPPADDPEFNPAALTSRALLLKTYTFDLFDGTNWGHASAEEWQDIFTAKPFKDSRLHRPKRATELGLTVEYLGRDQERPFVFSLPYAALSIDSVQDGLGKDLKISLQYDRRRDVLRGRTTDPQTSIATLHAHCALPLAAQSGHMTPYDTASQFYKDHTRVAAYTTHYLSQNWPEMRQFEPQKQRNPYTLARELEQWFQKSFRYSLDVRPNGQDAILQFLCNKEQRSGHCEYFASAMVVALRYFEIPARLVVGYSPRLLSAEQLEWEITASSSHAWVEAYFEDIGWVSFDPTAPEYRAPSTKPGPSEMMSPPLAPEKPPELPPEPPLYVNDPVLEYSERAQTKVLEGFFSTLTGIANGLAWLRDLPFMLLPESWRPESGLMRSVILLALLAAASVPLMWRWRRSREVRDLVRAGLGGRSARRSSQPSDLYRELLKVLAARGFRRRPSQTPREFANTVVRFGGPGVAVVHEATDAFYNLRFHGKTPAGLSQYRRLLKQLAARLASVDPAAIHNAAQQTQADERDSSEE